LTNNFLYDIINIESEAREMTKIKNTYVLVITKDRNGKEHFVVCENMEVAKKYNSLSAQKQFVTFIKE
jgi:membrane-bound lytic murein transglycosylase B